MLSPRCAFCHARETVRVDAEAWNWRCEACKRSFTVSPWQWVGALRYEHLVARYERDQARAAAALDTIRAIGDPDWRDAQGHVPPLMPCWECRDQGRGPFHSHGPNREAMFGPSAIELLDARAWCYCCHRCGSVFQNNGNEGLAEALLNEDER
jgi:hypothetical protein